MWTAWGKLFIFLFAVLADGQAQDEHDYSNEYEDAPETTTKAILAKGEKKMSEYILNVLKRFQEPDQVGIPEADIPDPMPVPDTTKFIGFTTLVFKDTAVHGFSKFRVLHINSEIASMKVTAHMSVDNLEAKGNCVANSFLTSVQSPFSVKLRGINITAIASLGVSRDGKLIAQDIAMEVTYHSISMAFEDAGALGFIISGFINTAGNFLFESIKPYLLDEAYANAKEAINNKLEEVAGDLHFPNTISPLDMVMIDLRKRVRAMNMDPYKIEDYNSTVGIFFTGLHSTYITGISSFKRVGNISLTLDNNTVIADFEIGTEELGGTTQWEVSAINGVLTRAGTFGFSIKYINGRCILAQPVDMRKRPQLIDLSLDIGNLQIRSDGAGTIDYIVESAVNILPNLLRYQIINVLETPMKWKIQKELNEFNTEEIIKQELPKIDEYQGFKLSELRAIKEEEANVDKFFYF